MKKTIAIYIQNRLLLSGIAHAIEAKKDLTKIEIIPDIESCLSSCRQSKADMLLAELRDYQPLTLENWLSKAKEIKVNLPRCKIVLLVDEENFPQSAEEAKKAFKNEEIDMFFYSTSGLNYLVDAITSL